MKFLAAASCSFVLALIVSLASAAEVPFDQAQFDAARAAGKPVAVVFHADWCPTCRTQAPVLKKLTQTPAFKSLAISSCRSPQPHPRQYPCISSVTHFG